MDISIGEYANARGISLRRAQSLASSGQIQAHRLGSRSWAIDSRELSARRSIGRPMNPAMAWAMICALSGRPSELIRNEERARLKRNLERLAADENPARLLHSWLRRRELQVVKVEANPADLAEIASDSRFLRSGISDDRSGISAGRELEGYVNTSQLASFLADNLLVSSDSPNVRLHVVDRIVSGVAPLGLVVADLADWNGPREDHRVRELIEGAIWNH